MATTPRPSGRRTLRQRCSTVRAKATIAATLVVAVTLVLSAVTLRVLLRRSLQDSLEGSAKVRAAELATLVRTGAVPDELAVHAEEDALTQIVSPSGEVIAASGNLTGRGSPRPVTGRRQRLRRSPSDSGRATTLMFPCDRAPVGDARWRHDHLRRIQPRSRRRERGRDDEDRCDRRPARSSPSSPSRRGSSWDVRFDRSSRSAPKWPTSPKGSPPARARTRTDDEVGRLARTMNATLDRLAGSVERQRRFVADASHELQSPVASAQVVLDVAMAHPDEADWPRGGRRPRGARAHRAARPRPALPRPPGGRRRPGWSSVPVDLDDVVHREVARLDLRPGLRVDASGVRARRGAGRRRPALAARAQPPRERPPATRPARSP